MAKWRTGSDRLFEKLRDISGKLSRPAVLRVGFLEGATEADGTSVALVAATNEYGRPSRGQPPRPFFRIMIDRNRKDWPKQLAGILGASNYDAATALDRFGLLLKDQLQDSIRELMSPPLAPSTIARKGFDKPLIDTGTMLNSVDYEVKT